MTDVKRLLAEATPLPWRWEGDAFYGWRGEDAPHVSFSEDEPDRLLILHAVNHLPDYLAAVEALERLVDVLGPAAITWTDPVPADSAFALTDARAALARLRDEVPA